MDTNDFLQALFQDGIDGEHRLSIFCLPSRTTKRFDNTAEAVKFALAQAENENVYFGLGLIGGSPHGRGKLANVVGIGGLWADIDLADEQHSKPNLPPNEAEARKIFAGIPLKPSIIVNSGGGLHVYWIFKEPWIFDSDDERTAAGKLCKRLGATLRSEASKLGYDIDSVGDLTRVLRLPGTLNHKYPKPRAVITADIHDGKYLPDDFENILVDDDFCAWSTTVVEVDDIVLSAEADAPTEKLTALIENDINFKRSWNRQNSKLSDQSASAYCLSLANTAVAAGWVDQEIANLIIAWRRRHKDKPEKALRWDWIKNHILTPARRDTKSSIEDLADKAHAIPDSQAKRSFILQQISRELGLPIVRWMQHGKVDAKYSMQLAGGQWIPMGNVSDITTTNRFRDKVYEAIGKILFTSMKAKKWAGICNCLGQVVEVVDNPESRPDYEANQWITNYLKNRPDVSDGAWQFKAANNLPLLKDGQIYIHAGELREHLRTVLGERITNPKMCQYLKLAGYTQKNLSWRFESLRSATSYWHKPYDDLAMDANVGLPLEQNNEEAT